MAQLSVRRFMAVYLTLFGYFGDTYGSASVNSNAIKNLAGGGGLNPAHTISPSPRSPVTGSDGQKLVADTLQSHSCLDDDECGADEFCNDVRGACLPCRKSRKRCARDSMCCGGNRCSNGVCQAADVDAIDSASVGHRHNLTTDVPAKKQHLAQGHQVHSSKGQEGETCLRSSDCSEGLCCARHFWSRICKPVLTEGQVCTRHRRKGSHGLELFQRCDCGDGLACRPERGERDHAVSRTQARNLHTCQRR